jgi:hypothetical protein
MTVVLLNNLSESFISRFYQTDRINLVSFEGCLTILYSDFNCFVEVPVNGSYSARGFTTWLTAVPKPAHKSFPKRLLDGVLQLRFVGL